MPVAIRAAPKKRKKPGVPSYLIYETLNGRPLYYKGYRDVIAGKKKPAEIMGSSSLEAMLASLLLGYLSTYTNREQHLLATNQFGIDINEANRLTNDIGVFTKTDKLTLTNKSFNLAPQTIIEVDVRIDAIEFAGRELSYVYEKTQRLLDFGVERIIWITTQPRKIFTATQTAPWTTQNWDADVPVLDDVVLNLAGLLTEEGIEF